MPYILDGRGNLAARFDSRSRCTSVPFVPGTSAFYVLYHSDRLTGNIVPMVYRHQRPNGDYFTAKFVPGTRNQEPLRVYTIGNVPLSNQATDTTRRADDNHDVSVHDVHLR